MFEHFSFETEEGPWQVRVHNGFGGRCGKHHRGGDERTEHGGPFESRGFRGGPREWGRGRGFGPGFGGGGRERMFDGGELQLVILHLLAEEPSYGYQLIKRLEERLAGGYTPSAGVIYPTLTLLEESGFTEAATTEGKKVYSVTAEGKAHLEANKARLDEVLARLDHAENRFRRGRSPEIMEAFMNLRSAVQARMTRGNLTKEQIRKLSEAINAAAKAIDEL